MHMEAVATINARMPEELKRGGSRVLERNGVSPTEIVRSVYRYMDRNQEIPGCLDVAPREEETVYQKRRALLRQFDVMAASPASGAASCELDCKAERANRIEAKYGDLL